MSPSEQAGLSWCLDDVRTRRSWLERLRGEATYHYDLDKALETGGDLGGPATSLYFSESHNNCFYPLSDVTPHRIFTEGFGFSYPGEVKRAAFEFGGWAHDASEQLAHVFAFIVYDFATQHLGLPTDPRQDELDHASLVWAPACADVSLPFFVRWTERDQARREMDLSAADQDGELAETDYKPEN